MKKILLALLLMLASTVGAASSAVNCPQQSVLDVVKQRGELIAGVRQDAPPWGYVDKDGQIVGFDVDIAHFLAKQLNVKLKLVPVTSKTRIAELLNGNIDILTAGTAHTIERNKVVDFSITYYRGGTQFLVRKDSSIKGYRGLAGKTVAIAPGVPYQEMLLQKQPKAKVIVYQSYADAVLALSSGKIDAVMSANDILDGLAIGKPQLAVVGNLLDFPSFTQGLSVRQNDSEWLNWINFTLIDMWKNGQIQGLYRKYLGHTPEDFQMETWEI